MTAAEVKAIAKDAHKVIRKLATADREVKAELYKALGVRATYFPADDTAELVAQPVCVSVRVGGPSRTISTREIRARVPLLLAG